MTLQEQREFRRMEEQILRQKLEIKALKFERERRQKQIMRLIDKTVELLKMTHSTEDILDHVIAFYR